MDLLKRALRHDYHGLVARKYGGKVSNRIWIMVKKAKAMTLGEKKKHLSLFSSLDVSTVSLAEV